MHHYPHMRHEKEPFETIESAQAFIGLLANAVDETRLDIEQDLSVATEDQEYRRADALRLTLLKIQQLSSHVHKSARLLNDLRTLRILLFRERAAGAAVGAHVGMSDKNL
jgi:excinuclease UvrABC nuclease subunit